MSHWECFMRRQKMDNVYTSVRPQGCTTGCRSTSMCVWNPAVVIDRVTSERKCSSIYYQVRWLTILAELFWFVFCSLLNVFNLFIAHLIKAQVSLCRGAASVVRQLFPLNNFFSRTTEPNSTKHGRKYHWGMGIQIC